MEADLLRTIEQDYGQELTDVVRHHVQYAKANRLRARKTCHEIKANTNFVFKERRVLEVGCGHGGFVVTAASLGADSWGVEINDKFFRYSQLNAQGELGSIHLIHGDFLAPSVISQLPGTFDLVLVNDVFEHVYDTCRLLQHLNAVMSEGALLVFTIPNGEAIKSIRSEGHYLKAGLTLLAPSLWHYVVRWFSAYYHPWSYYEGLMGAFGFTPPDKWNGTSKLRFDKLVKTLRTELDDLQQVIVASQYSENISTAMLESLRQLRARAEKEIEQKDADLLNWNYFVDFWKGSTRKRGVPHVQV